MEDLFNDKGLTRLTTDNPLVGLRVRIFDRCKYCNCAQATVGSSSGPHRARLLCEQCRAHRGWLKCETFNFISEAVEKFGKPTELIEIRRERP